MKIDAIYGTEGPCFIYGLDRRDADEAERVYERARQMTDKPFILAAIMANDWNADFSPWKAAGVRGGEGFAGGGPETLGFIKDDLIPRIRRDFPNAGQMITAGYSLAGLFSLWALYELPDIDGAVSGSGSLWFPGWEDYAARRTVRQPARVYLSLGDREERTKNPVMARVGDATRLQAELLSREANVSAVTLEWNPGGHFADVPEGKGIKWMVEEINRG